MNNNFFDFLHEKYSDGKPSDTTGFSLISGWAISIYIMYDATSWLALFSWESLIKAFYGISISVITVIATDLYKYYKPKALKFGKKKKLLIIKFFKNGKDKRKRA